MRQAHWSNGSSIVVYVLPSKNPLHKAFCQNILKLFPYQLDRVWHRLTYSGYGVAPIEVTSEQELILAVQSTKGAIGYIRSLPENINVKIIKVDN